MDLDTLWHSLEGGAIIAAALALTRVLLDYAFQGSGHRADPADLRQTYQRDAQARLERVLHDRLADADRRLQRYELEAQAGRLRCATLEHEYGRLLQTYDVLKEQHALLQAEHARALRRPRQPANPQIRSLRG